MNLIDILLLIIILSSAITGWHRGFILGLLDLIRWIGSLLIGLRFYPYAAGWLEELVNWSTTWILPVAFLLVTFTASLLLHYLGSLLLQNLPHTLHKRSFNKALGLVPGVFSGLVTAVILAALLLAIPLPQSMEATVQNSKLANRFAAHTERIEMALAPVFEDAAQRTLNKLTVQPGSDEFIELPYRVEQATPRPDLEAQMLELLNEERLENGLPPLQADTALREVARQHSEDMFRRGYFSHHSPEGDTPFDRIREANVRFLAAGENLALAPTLTIAHEGLMNSPGHRANILQRRFGRVGIGVLQGGPGRLMITQNFRN
ncbi:colicin V production protein [Pontibacter diazotrophicus]|uniref:Colicin V production protein n=1 Tax=Pontibacter diazotrophicus TaxID=1400979 RepID=A0A3D8L9A6_9BACT|nr:CvpA family protein [Pontibacter diazotrophicus]RDV13990.1 colicin V production protein [Pontibacter diazotrophicus]